MPDIPEQVMIVTGASQGLGKAVALAAARRGARVGLLGRARERLEAVATEIRKVGREAMVLVADVRGESAVRRTVGDVIERWGGIDVLINVAGTKVEGPIDANPADEDVDAFAVNYHGTLRCIRAVLPVMRRQRSGHVINVSSVLGKRATPYRGAYAASKAALNAATDALRVELAGTGVSVTLVCPGRLGDDGRWSMTYERAADAIMRCIERRSREKILTFSARCLVRLDRLFPSIVDRLLQRVRNKRATPPPNESTVPDKKNAVESANGKTNRNSTDL